MKYKLIILFFLLIIGLSGEISAQEKVAANDVAQANNPIANFTVFNVHYYYIGELCHGSCPHEPSFSLFGVLNFVFRFVETRTGASGII
jgi:hypothetical protein